MFVDCNGVSGIFCRFLGELLMMEIQGFQTVLYMRMSIHLVTAALLSSCMMMSMVGSDTVNEKIFIRIFVKKGKKALNLETATW
jgi:hypothetical protein